MANEFQPGDPVTDRRSTRKTIHKFAKLATPWGTKVQLKTQCGRWMWPPDCDTPSHDKPRCPVCFKAEMKSVAIILSDGEKSCLRNLCNDLEALEREAVYANGDAVRIIRAMIDKS